MLHLLFPKLTAHYRKSFHFTENHTFFTLYKPLVRSVIEYGNTIWGTHYTLDQQNIERIQQRATRTLTNLYDTPYPECLLTLGLHIPSLQ